MKILREGVFQNSITPTIKYIPSFYNFEEKLGCNCYIYNTVTGALIKTSKDLNNIENFSESQKIQLVNNGILVPEFTDEFRVCFSGISPTQKGNPSIFTIVITTTCNAKCFYCYEENYHKETMSEENIWKVICYLITNIKDKEEFTLDWYGGEPLLCVSEIDQIIQSIKLNVDLQNKKWGSSITTNATLFTPELVNKAVFDWRLKSAHITIDGTEYDHNNRKNTIPSVENAFRSTINAIHMLLKNNVYVNLRIHLDNNNKNDFGEMLREIEPFFKYKKFNVFPTYLFPPEFYSDESYICDKEKEELFYNIFKILNRKGYCNLIDSLPYPRTCGCFATRSNTVVIAPNGTLHSCVQEFLGLDSWVNDNKFLSYPNSVESCKKCKFFPICLGGCIHNKYLSGSTRTPCVRNRYIIKPLLKLISEQG